MNANRSNSEAPPAKTEPFADTLLSWRAVTPPGASSHPPRHAAPRADKPAPDRSGVPSRALDQKRSEAPPPLLLWPSRAHNCSRHPPLQIVLRFALFSSSRCRMWLAVEWGVVLAHYGENGWGQGEGRRGGGQLISCMSIHCFFQATAGCPCRRKVKTKTHKNDLA